MLKIFAILLVLCVSATADTTEVVTVDTVNYGLIPLADSLMCGDANYDGALDMDDVVYLLDFMYRGRPAIVMRSVMERVERTKVDTLVNCVPVNWPKEKHKHFGELQTTEVPTSDEPDTLSGFIPVVYEYAEGSYPEDAYTDTVLVDWTTLRWLQESWIYTVQVLSEYPKEDSVFLGIDYVGE